MNKKIIIEDITRMKNLFVYKPGKVISEQITTSPEQQAIIDKGKKYTEITPTVSKTEVVPVAPAATTPGNNPMANTPIGLIQTKLVNDYKLNIGTSGVNKDGVDGKWGNLSQTAFNQAKAIKAKSTPAVAPAADSVVTSSAANKPFPPITYKSNTTTDQQANIDKGKKDTKITPTVSKTEVVPVQKTPEQIRQQSRYDQGIARQSRRNERRKGNMSQT